MMKLYKTMALAALAAGIFGSTALASNIVEVSQGDVMLSLTNARNELVFSENGKEIRFMLNRNDDNWYELQMANKGNFFSYGLYWRIREEALGGLVQRCHITQYQEQDSGRYFYGVDIYSDVNDTYHSYLVGRDANDAAHEYVDSYYFAGKRIQHPHIWAENGSLYIGHNGPDDESNPSYELYWSQDSQWFGYNAL